MSSAPHRVRMSAALSTLLAVVGPNASAAHRALLLLGAATAGYDLSACRSDIGHLLGEELDGPVLQRLAVLYAACRLAEGQGQGTDQAAAHTQHYTVPDSALTDSAPPDSHDPFASVGIEV